MNPPCSFADLGYGNCSGEVNGAGRLCETHKQFAYQRARWDRDEVRYRAAEGAHQATRRAKRTFH